MGTVPLGTLSFAKCIDAANVVQSQRIRCFTLSGVFSTIDNSVLLPVERRLFYVLVQSMIRNIHLGSSCLSEAQDFRLVH